MPKKIRVHELAKELGLSNPETLEILKDLKIDAKSHSSSIEDAQADRARRKADAEGLRREPVPEPPKAKKESEAAEPEAAPSAEPAAPTEAPKARKVVSARSSAAPAPALATPRAATPRPPSAEAPSAPARPAAVAPDLGAKPAPATAARPAAAGPDLGAKPAPRPGNPGEAEGESPTVTPEGGEAPKPPTSASGAPIPPPPRRPVSASGRPIPPPPGQGGRRPSPPARPGGRPGGPGGRPGGPGGTGGPGAGRPSGPGAGRPGAPMGAPGMGGPPPGAGRGGMPQGRRPPQRRAKRRRRVVEELEPTQMTAYVPSNAPIPEGEIVVERGSTARDLGPKLNRSAGDVVRFLLLQGEMVTANQSLSDDMIELFAVELGAEIRMVDPGEEQEAELLAKYFEDDDETDDGEQLPRAPVVTVMGHVDHGKTLLLDRIRSADVVSGEAGGITQHVGAYQVNWNGHPITFIDTPGHEAFTAMRARGAKVTDIVILVVAADDGVMPQTIEAIAHAKAAEVPIIVAVNKMDRPDANPDRVLQQIAERELVPEKWGGDTICVEISALQQTGIQELLEQVVLVAEIAELTASLEGNGRGAVLEANLEVGRGPVATVIVQSGIIKVGDAIVAGAAWGKVKALINDRGEAIKQAGPSTPVQILGFSEPPLAG
ncbi:MAG: translation initiation factor IF-2, partial [Actinobacteria bacterium]|nr:translation initiation factor IF-2 [Actinomycetota bacterium]